MHDIIHQFVHLQTDFFVVSFVESHKGLHFWILRLICDSLAEPNGFHQIVDGLTHGIRDGLGSDQAGMMRSLEWMNLISFRSEFYNTRHHSPKYRFTSHQLEGCPILWQIYALHCIVLYPRKNRLTTQYNWERLNPIEYNTMLCINLSG